MGGKSPVMPSKVDICSDAHATFSDRSRSAEPSMRELAVARLPRSIAPASQTVIPFHRRQSGKS